MTGTADTTHRKATLPSGLLFLSERVPAVRSVSLGVWVNTGSRDEAPAEAGMAHMVEHLLFKGTESRSAAQVAREVDALGGHLDAFTTREFTCFHLSLLDDRVDSGVDLLADLFLHPLFEERDIELERGVVLEEIGMCRDNPEDDLHDLTSAQVWGGNPLGRPILGTPETVSSFRREHVRDFVGRHYHAGRAFLTAAGNLDHDAVVALAAERFTPVSAGPADAGREAPSFHPGVVRREKPLNQVYIDLNLPGIPQAHPLRHTGHVLNAILGGSLSSRLFQKIREERGLVYSIYSGMSSHADCGLLHVSASTGPEQAREVVRLIVEELAVLRQKVPGAEEVRRAKDHLLGNLVLSLESTANRMHLLGKQQLYFGRHVEVEETMAAIEAVDASSLEEATALILGGGASWGFLGPVEGLPSDTELPTW